VAGKNGAQPRGIRRGVRRTSDLVAANSAVEPSRLADDVAQMTTGTVNGSRVTLRNVRNFEWRSDTDYTQRWETRNTTSID